MLLGSIYFLLTGVLIMTFFTVARRLFVVTTAVVVVVRTEAGVGGRKRSDGDVTTSLTVAVLALAVKGTSAVCG